MSKSRYQGLTSIPTRMARVAILPTLLLVGHLKGCDTQMQPPSVFMAEKCEIPKVTTEEADRLTRGTQESIIITNESIDAICQG